MGHVGLCVFCSQDRHSDTVIDQTIVRHMLTERLTSIKDPDPVTWIAGDFLMTAYVMLAIVSFAGKYVMSLGMLRFLDSLILSTQMTTLLPADVQSTFHPRRHGYTKITDQP
jgi:hypothetical protein